MALTPKERALRDFRLEGKFFHAYQIQIIKKATIKKQLKGREGRVLRTDILKSDLSQVITTGVIMENIEDRLSSVTSEVTTARDVLRDLLNETRTLSDNLDPLLSDLLKNVRLARMGIVSELNQCIAALKQMSDYSRSAECSADIAKLKELSKVLDILKQMNQDGTLEEVTNTLIRLSLKEVTA